MYALKKLAENTKNLTQGRIFILTFKNPDLQSLVISLNKDQLQLGLLADETYLPDYSYVSVAVYGKRAGPWTLYDTGYFYSTIKVLGVDEDAIIEWADSQKPDKDLADFGAILGLSGESIALLIDEALPEMQEVLQKEMLDGIT